MQTSRLSLVISGAFLHPWEQTPIDLRCGEDIATTQVPLRQMLRVDRRQLLGSGPVRQPRCAILTNLAGLGRTTYPTPDELAAIQRQVLLVGLLPPGALLDQEPGWLRLLPARPGKDREGQSQLLWLAPGSQVVLAPAASADAVPVRALLLPGPDVSGET